MLFFKLIVSLFLSHFQCSFYHIFSALFIFSSLLPSGRIVSSHSCCLLQIYIFVHFKQLRYIDVIKQLSYFRIRSIWHSICCNLIEVDCFAGVSQPIAPPPSRHRPSSRSYLFFLARTAQILSSKLSSISKCKWASNHRANQFKYNSTRFYG